MSGDGTASEVYTLACLSFGGSGESDSLLSSVRKEALGGRTVRGASSRVENGLEVKIRYKAGSGCFRWRKTCGKTILQESFRQRDGAFCLLEHNLSGALVSKTSYGSDLKWRKTAYYEGDNRPRAVLAPFPAGGLELLLRKPSGQGYARTRLLPCPMYPGTALQSYVNSVAGEPKVRADTDAGAFCFCTEKEQKLRLSVFERVKQDGGTLKERLPEEEAVGIDFQYVPNTSIDLKTAVPPEPEPEIEPEPQPETEPLSVGPLISQTSAEELVSPESPLSDYAADHELFSVESPVEKPLPSPDLTGPEAVPASTPLPKRYGVASKGLRDAAVRESGTPKNGKAIDGLFEDHLIPAKRIVVSSVESYLYFGKILNGLRQGQGRTQMQNGHTAYEGAYADDLRDGFGVYYYKSGRLCYAGGWKRNLRNGMGVAFGSRDGSIFVGNWENNIPTGQGSAFDMDGNLIYTGEWKNGMRHGKGTEYRDGRAVHTGEWKNDQFYAGYRYVEKPSSSEGQRDAVD